jgi:ABC-type Zn uptake system ZnuABC Zn-binding protein ZnuA
VRPRPSARLGLIVAALVVAFVASACDAFANDGRASPTGPGSGAVVVVTSTTVLADLVRQVGREHVSVTSLVPAGGEVHTFEPRPSDVQRVAEADLVVVNGLGLDAWVAALAADAGTHAPIVALAEDLPGVAYLEGTPHAGETEGGAGEHGVNPHLWLDVANARAYVGRIDEALRTADPANAAAYEAASREYEARLEQLDEYARDTLGAIPQADRKVISFHDAFPYFAAAYGIEIVDTVVAAPGQDPSARAIADLVGVIRDEGVRAILAEAQFSPDLVRTLADETGVVVVSDLYTDSLGEPPVDTYEGLIRWDVDRVAAALRGS